jgi:hypothetical protein
MTAGLVVVGAGGFGREVLDVVDAINAVAAEPVWQVAGVVDDAPSAENLARLARRGVAHLGAVEEYLATAAPASYVVGVGSPPARRQLAERFEAAGHAAATLMHPSATQGFDVEIGAGSVVCAGVRLTTNVRIGRHVHLNLNATVGHDAVLGDYVSANPIASISGDVTIDDEVLIGVGGVILNGLRLGRGSTVGGSACVVRDVPPGVVVKGVPAR